MVLVVGDCIGVVQVVMAMALVLGAGGCSGGGRYHCRQHFICISHDTRTQPRRSEGAGENPKRKPQACQKGMNNMKGPVGEY
jgi:hypothetical protein